MTVATERPRTAAPSGTSRLLSGSGPSFAELQASFGPLPVVPDLAGLLDQAGLHGRGGAGFPTGRKIRTVASLGRGVVVANGSEGEPASDKDRALLLLAPHLVLDGLVLAARAVGARRAYVATASGEVADRLRRAVAARPEKLAVEVVQVEDRFVSGEESALVNLLNGRPPVPSDRSVRVFERGVSRRPTLVQNVETLAHLALLVRYGAEWFREVGTQEEPGTFLATVSGAVSTPGVYETAFGTSIATLLEATGTNPQAAQAVLVGGYHGAWVAGRHLPRTRMSRASLAHHDARVGAGVVAVLGRDQCGLVKSADVASYLAGQVVGQCGPCLNGLPRMADAMRRLARRERDDRLVDEVHRLRRLVDGRGACAHPDGTARFVASTMHVFADEVAVHLGGGCSVAAAR
jgi:NADH:ubiquinone oxidoreductase subunit F (NADH-binding)